MSDATSIKPSQKPCDRNGINLYTISFVILILIYFSVQKKKKLLLLISGAQTKLKKNKHCLFVYIHTDPVFLNIFLRLEKLTMPVLIDRLVLRKLFPYAIKICEYLKVPDAEGKSRILAHWACYKVILRF